MYIDFLRNPLFPVVVVPFTFPQAGSENPSSATSLSALGAVSVFNFTRSDKWHHVMVFLCTFLTSNDEHLCVCVFAGHVSSLVKGLFKSLAYLK